MNNDELKKSVKNSLSLTSDYTITEMCDALIMKDTEKLEKMKNRCEALQAEYDKFVVEIESGDENRRQTAISTFKRSKYVRT